MTSKHCSSDNVHASTTSNDYTSTRHNLENILTDRALFGMAESELRGTLKQKQKQLNPKKHKVAKVLLPHEKGYLAVLADTTGEEPDRVTIAPGEVCTRCQGNKSAFTARIQTDAEKHAAIADLLRSDESLTETTLSLRCFCNINNDNDNLLATPAKQQTNKACWLWYVAELTNAGYTDHAGYIFKPIIEAELRRREQISEYTGTNQDSYSDVDNDYGVDIDPDQNQKQDNAKKKKKKKHLNDITEMPKKVLQAMLAKIEKLEASVIEGDDSTNIRGLPIPPVFRIAMANADALDAKEAKEAKHKRKLKVPTNFKKEPPKLNEQLVFDFDGTASILRVVTVTGFRPKDKGFVVDNGMKVSWSGKPKNSVHPDARIRRDPSELHTRNRECTLSMLENMDWSELNDNALSQLVATITNARILRKQHKTRFSGDQSGKHRKPKNNSSKHTKHQGK